MHSIIRNTIIPLFVALLAPLCIAGEEAEKDAELVKAMTADQKTYREKYIALRAKLNAAEKKAADTKNSIESTEVLEEGDKFCAELTEVTAKPIKGWAGICGNVSSRKGSYSVSIFYRLATDEMRGNQGVSFNCKTQDDKLVSVMKSLKEGDVVKFSGEYKGPPKKYTRHTTGFNVNLRVHDFDITALEIVKAK